MRFINQHSHHRGLLYRFPTQKDHKIPPKKIPQPIPIEFPQNIQISYGFHPSPEVSGGRAELQQLPCGVAQIQRLQP